MSGVSCYHPERWMEVEAVNTVSSSLQNFCFSHRRITCLSTAALICACHWLNCRVVCLCVVVIQLAVYNWSFHTYSRKSRSAGHLPDFSVWCFSNMWVRAFAFSFWSSAAGNFCALTTRYQYVQCILNSKTSTNLSSVGQPCFNIP